MSARDRAGQKIHPRRADKAGDGQRLRSFVEHIRFGVLLDPAGPHHRDAGGQRHRLDLVVRHIDDGRSEALMQALQLDPHLGAQLGIEIGQRLVEQKHLGLLHQCSSNRDPLALTAGELREFAIEHPADLQQLGGPGDAPFDLGLRHKVQYGCRTAGACTSQENYKLV
jgi:hypothetical protein